MTTLEEFFALTNEVLLLFDVLIVVYLVSFLEQFLEVFTL
jgi:hypothetical protein